MDKPQPLSMPAVVNYAILSMVNDRKAGQVILNFNEGKLQSFEVKEHTRL